MRSLASYLVILGLLVSQGGVLASNLVLTDDEKPSINPRYSGPLIVSQVGGLVSSLFLINDEKPGIMI
jgi:hypothetical protein